MENESLSYAVVGGGMMGMVIALRLAEAGHQVELFEAANELGGLAAPWELADGDGKTITWDRHYHVTLLSDSFTRGVLADLDLDASVNWVETKTGYCAEGQLVSMSNALEYLSLPGLSMIEKCRIAATILYGSRVNDFRTLEEIPVEAWLTRLSGASAFERLWRPLLEAKLGEAWRESSAAFIWATIQRLYAARQAGLKKEMFGYVPGGYRSVVDSFRSKLEARGVRIRTGVAVKKVRSAEGRVHLDSSEGGEFDRAVLTVTPRVASRLCSGLLESERSSLESVRYQGVVCASMLLEKKLADYYLTYLTDDWVPFTAVVEMTAFISPQEIGGRHLVYLPKYAPSDAPVFSMSDAELQESYVAGLERLYPHFNASQVRGFKVSRVPEVFPLPTLGYSKNLPPTSFSQLPGVIAISSAHIQNGTLNVNDTVKVAERAAKSLLLQKGRRLFLD